MSSLYFRARCWLPALAVVFCLGSFTVSAQDEPPADKIAEWRKAAEQGFAPAQFNLGLCYSKGKGVAKDAVEAAKWYRKSAEQGDADAQFNLGIFYANGKGVAKDTVEAAKWYRKAAEQGDADAQFNLGFCCENGEGVAKDEAEAVK
ncbi:MAG: tetratricopeptide repeat protein, partial [Verrucomicrobiota bacterium]